MGSKERRVREKETRRRQIQEAAMKLFIKHGFNATTLEDIVKKVELTPGAIYRHFKSKDELFASLLMTPLERMCDRMKEIRDDNGLDVEQKVLAIKDAMFDTIETNQLMLRNTFFIQLELKESSVSSELTGDLADLSKRLLKRMSDVFDEGVSQGRFVPRKGVVYADMFWGWFTGITMWEESKKRLDPKKDFLKSTIEQSFEVFMTGIKSG